MTQVAEIARLIVRLTGDSKLYVQTLKDADKQASEFVRDANGYFRNLQGQFVSVQEVMRSQAANTIQRIQAYGMHLKELGKIGTQTAQKLKSVGMSLSLRLTAPLVGAAALGAREFLKYDTALMQIKNLVGANDDELKQYDQTIRQMSGAVAKGPVELADALYFITGAGFKGQQALDILRVSAEAASAGLGETKPIADAVTSAINAYGASNLSAARATDILVSAVKFGKMEASELAPVLGQIIPTASAMKIGFDQVAGAMAVMSRTGLNSAEAAVSLQGVMSTLLKPSKEGAKLLAEYGLDMGKLREMAQGPQGLIKVMRLLNETFRDDDEALAQIVPNVRAFRGVMNVLAQDASIVDEIMEGVANSVGDAQEAFQGGEGSASREWARAMAELKVAMLELGDALSPAITTLGDAIKSLSGWFVNLSNTGKSVVLVLGGIAAATGPVLIMLGSLVGVISSVVTAVGTLMASEAGLKALLKILPYLGTVAAGFGLALAGVAAVMIYKFHPATLKLNAELERMKRLQEELASGVGKRFAASMGEASALPIAQQKSELERMVAEAQGSLEAAQREASKSKTEIARMSDSSMSGNGWLGPIADAQGIKMEQQRLEDMRQSVKMYQAQVEEATAKLNELNKAAAPVTTGASKVRNPAIAELMKDLENNLATAGMTEVQKQVYMLQQELTAGGESLNEVELTRLNLLDQELTKLEEAKKLEKEREQVYQDMAQKAAQIMQQNLSPIEKIRAEIDDMHKLVASGALSRADAGKAINRLVSEEADKGGMGKTGGSAAIQAGTREAYSMTHFGSLQRTTEKGVWELVKKTEVHTKTSKDILAELKTRNAPKPEAIVRIPGG